MHTHKVVDNLKNRFIMQNASTGKTAAEIYAIKLGYKGKCKRVESGRLTVTTDKGKVMHFDIIK